MGVSEKNKSLFTGSFFYSFYTLHGHKLRVFCLMWKTATKCCAFVTGDNIVTKDPMKALTEFIAKALVENPDQVDVTQSRQGSRIRLELKVSKDDMGRVIGKSGRVANAIRVLLRVAAERDGQQVTLDVVEP